MSDQDVFGTSVVQAVAASLGQNKPLVVLLVAAPDSSTAADEPFSRLFALQNVSEMVRNRAIALKLVESTQDYTNFAQIFPVKKVPSIYIIQRNQIMDVIGDPDIPENEFFERLLKHLPESVASSSIESPEASSPHIQNQPQQASTSHSPKSDQPSKAPAHKSQNDNDKLSESQKFQMRLKTQRQAEKEERQRILRQIEADRQERRQQRRPSESHEQKPTSKSISSNASSSASLSAQCALAIRLFDGQAVKHNFAGTDRLADVRVWLDQNRTDGNQAYSFFQSFPKYLYGEGEEYETLKALRLTPSATLILKPAQNAANAYGRGESWLQSGARALSGAVSAIFGYGYERVEDHDEYAGENEQAGDTASGSSSHERKEGNIRTLRNPNDDRTTYNGNQLSLEDDKDAKKRD